MCVVLADSFVRAERRAYRDVPGELCQQPGVQTRIVRYRPEADPRVDDRWTHRRLRIVRVRSVDYPDVPSGAVTSSSRVPPALRRPPWLTCTASAVKLRPELSSSSSNSSGSRASAAR